MFKGKLYGNVGIEKKNLNKNMEIKWGINSLDVFK